MSELTVILEEIKAIQSDMRALTDRMDNLEDVFINQIQTGMERLKEPLQAQIKNSQADRRVILGLIGLTVIAVLSTKISISLRNGTVNWSVESGIDPTTALRILEIGGILGTGGIGAYALANLRVEKKQPPKNGD